MIDLTNLIIKPSYKKLTKEELTEISNNSAYAIENVVNGLQSVGSLMFFASSNDDYDGEELSKDICNIGLLITANAKLLKGILEVNSEADYHLANKERKNEPSN